MQGESRFAKSKLLNKKKLVDRVQLDTISIETTHPFIKFCKCLPVVCSKCKNEVGQMLVTLNSQLRNELREQPQGPLVAVRMERLEVVQAKNTQLIIDHKHQERQALLDKAVETRNTMLTAFQYVLWNKLLRP